jgi:putative cardiolipin synthase
MLLRRLLKGLLILAGAVVGALALIFAVLAVAAAYHATPELRADLEQAAVHARSDAPHRIHLLDDGAASLERRLALIAMARESIELEFFIYNVDEASRLVTQALMAKAAQGVKVRLLVDFSAPVFQLKPVYARFLRANGVDVRYYNTAALYRLFSVQHRSHRKLLIIDGHTVLTGGRNIADDYFDLSPRYNFIDSDIQVDGPIVQAVKASFDQYWNSALAEAPEGSGEPLGIEDLDHARKRFLPRPGDADLVRAAAGSATPPAFVCRNLSFTTDLPEKGEANRRVFATISEIGGAARHEVWVESPYFVIKDDGHALMVQMRRNGARIRVLTNSLHSTDAFYTVASLYSKRDWIAGSGIELYAYGGAAPRRLAEAAPGRGARWGIHSKRAVVDGHTVVVGTYNVDPRSANLNSELIVVCRDQPELAAAVLASIAERAQQAVRVMADGAVTDEEALFGSSGTRERLYLYLSIPLAWLFDFLL